MVCIQESASWGKLNGFQYSGLTVLCGDAPDRLSDCCFLVPSLWLPATRKTYFGRDWSGIVLGNSIFISAHIIDHTKEGGRAERVFQETLNYTYKIRSQFSEEDFAVVLGVDANVTLPADYDNVSGSSVLQPAPSHKPSMQSAVIGWMQALGVRALNTFGHQLGNVDPGVMWTCGTKRRLGKRTQIDFVCVSANMNGTASPSSVDAKCFRRSDHRPVTAHLVYDDSTFKVQCKERSLKGWRPAGEDELSMFQARCFEAAETCPDLSTFQARILDEARAIKFETSSQRRSHFRNCFNDEVRRLKLLVSCCGEEERRKTVVMLRKAKQRRRRANNEQALGSLRLATTRRQVPIRLRVDGELSENRSDWLVEAQKFGERRFGDVAKDPRQPRRALQEVYSAAKAAEMDGIRCTTPSLLMILGARSRLRSGSAAGADGCPPEVYKSIPFAAVVRAKELFHERLKEEASVDPLTWKIIEFIGLQKVPGAFDLEDFRWIAKLDCMQKWYLRSLRPCYQRAIRPTIVAAYGFKRGRNTGDVVNLIRTLLTFAHTWAKALQLHVYVSSQDVATAFDAMDHELLKEAMLKRGLHPRLVFGLLRELTDMKGHISIPSAGTSEPFDFRKGGKQGGVETPDEWNMLVEFLLEPLVRSWRERGFGIQLVEWATGITHVVWADNIWLIAASLEQLQIMTDELTETIYSARLRWKPKSLQILCGGLALGTKPKLSTMTTDLNILDYDVVECLEVLGSLLDGRGSTYASIHHRLRKAEGVFWSNSHAFLGPGSVGSKLKAWASGPASSSILDSSGWAINQGVMHFLRRWEFRWLRKLLRFRWKPNEGHMHFAKRTARIIERWATQHRFKMLHHRVLTAIYKEAYNEKDFIPEGGQPHTRELRAVRSRAWWDRIRLIPTIHKDPLERHSAPGQVAEWEDPLVTAFGVNWREIRNGFHDKAAWMKQCPSFINKICEAWGLPKLQLEKPVLDDELVEATRDAKRVKCIGSIHDRPVEHDSPEVQPLKLEWARGHQCFVFMVDCQALAEIINGRMPLLADELETCLEDAVNHLEALLARGWLPHGFWTDPVKWVRRSRNVVADYLCNVTMDQRQTWHEVFRELLPQDFNILVHSDGGSRSQCSAAAWIAEACFMYEGAWKTIPIACSGVFFECRMSSFSAEAWALYHAINFCEKFIRERET